MGGGYKKGGVCKRDTGNRNVRIKNGEPAGRVNKTLWERSGRCDHDRQTDRRRDNEAPINALALLGK